MVEIIGSAILALLVMAPFIMIGHESKKLDREIKEKYGDYFDK